MVFLLFATNVDIKDGFMNLEFKNNEKETSMQRPDSVIVKLVAYFRGKAGMQSKVSAFPHGHF